MAGKTIKSFAVGDQVMAIPQGSDIGLLFYRTDLLQRYGYRGPPESWDELDKKNDIWTMALILAFDQIKSHEEFELEKAKIGAPKGAM